MTPTQIVALVVRLFALFLVAYGLRGFADMAFFFEPGQPALPKIYLVLQSLFLLGLAGLLWFFPMSVSSKIVRSDFSSEQSQSWSADELYCVGFVLVGCLFLFWAISDGISWAILIASASVGEQDPFIMLITDWAAVIATVFEFLLAMSLIFGASGWRKLVYRIRYGRK